MAAKPGPDVPRYVPVPETGNGHKVRPDLQTKVVTAAIVMVFLGVLSWLSLTVLSLDRQSLASAERDKARDTIIDLRFQMMLSQMQQQTDTMKEMSVALREMGERVRKLEDKSAGNGK